MVAVLVLGALNFPLDNWQRVAGTGKSASDRFLNVGMSGGLFEGLSWIRDNTDEDDVLAVNRHLKVEGRNPFLGYFYYSAFSERRVFLEDWTFAVRASDTGLGSPFPERLELNDAVFARADPWAIRALADGAGVRELLVDAHADRVSPRLSDRVRLVHSNPDVRVYTISPEPARADRECGR